jgi:formylglycine-generating enzyme required for sulfatase activity
VINVSWHDANDYARWLSKKTGKNYRLPTEAEWEVAASGGSKTAFSFGNRISTAQANFDGNYT